MSDKERGVQAWRDWLMYGKHSEDFVDMSANELCDLAEKGLRDSQSEAVQPAEFVKIGILHRRREGSVDFLQEAEVIPLEVHGTLDVYMRQSASMQPEEKP